MELRPEFRFFGQIWPILHGFRPFSLDLAHFAWIWAILFEFGPYYLDLGPEGDKALKMWQGGGRTYVQTEGQIPLVFYRTSYPSGPLPRNDG